MKSSLKSLQTEPQPRISVFITSFNQKDYLREAIDSVLNQTLPPWEIIVVDDCSTDGSQELIQNYAARYPELIKPIFHHKNTGVAQSRIDALEAVNGDYVTYVDGDDRFRPTKIEKEYAALCRNRKASIAFSNTHYMTPEGHFSEAWIEDEKPPEGDVFMQTFGRMYPKRSLYRMELVDYQAWKSIGFHDPNLTIYEDFDMRIRMTKHLQTVYCDEVLSEIRDHGSGLSNSDKKSHIRSLDYIFQKNRPMLLDLKPTDRRAAEAGFRFWFNNVGKRSDRKKDQDNAKSHPNILPGHPLSYKGQDLIFVISQPRAGSTMLQRLIGGHQDVHATAEPWIMLHPLYALKRKGVNAEFQSPYARQGLDDFLTQFPEGEDLYVESLRCQASILYGRALALAGKRYFLDKTPRYYHIIPELHRIFPEARFVFLLRNPIAVFFSIFNTYLRGDPERIDPFIYRDLYEAPELLLDGIQLLGEKAIVVNYESLVSRPEEELRRIYTRLDLTFTRERLNYGQDHPPNGIFGDPTNIYKHDRPVSDYVNKWEQKPYRPDLVALAEAYLQQLGPHNLNRMGYVYDDIEIKIRQLKKRVHGNGANKAKAEELLASGEICAAEGHIDEAIQFCLQALVVKPDSGKAHNNLGVLYYRKNENAKALASYQEAVRLNPHNLCFKKNLADLYCYGNGPIEEAIALYRDILTENPNDVEARLGLAHICNQKGQVDDARFFYQQVIEIDPDHQDAFKMLTMINKGFVVDPSSVQTEAMASERTEPLESGENLEDELKVQLDQLAQQPDDAETIAAIASICMQLDRPADAIDFYLRILEQAPEHVGCARNARQALHRLEEQQVTDCNQSREAHLPASDDSILVSAIVSVYKAERFIHGCLKDLEAQTIADRMEIIVIDSASPENEKEIIEAFQDRFANIRYIRTKKRETVYAAWNRAIKAARGRYVTNANTDDRHSAAAFEIMSCTLDAHPEVALVYADCIITDIENETFAQCTPVGAYRWLAWDRRRLLEDGCFMGPQPMWRHSLHAEYGYFDDTFVTSGDYEFWLRISQTNDFLHISQFLGLYLRSPRSIEHSNRDRQKVENRRLRKWYRQALKGGRIIKRRQKIVAASDASRIAPHTSHAKARRLYEKGDLAGAVADLQKSLADRPNDWQAYRLLLDVIVVSGPVEEYMDLLLPLKARPDRPTDIEAQLGEVYIAAGDHSTALELAHKARIKNPTCARTSNLEGLIAYGEGRPDEALVKFQEAANLAPDWGTPWSHMATLYWEQEDTDNALTSFEKSFTLSPTAPNVAADYHTVLRATGRFQRARALFEKTVQRHPDFLTGWYFLIDILIQSNANQEAMAAIEMVILKFGADAKLLSAAAEIRKKLGPLQICELSDITLSLCMIVKNEGAHMARCLSSLKPVVDEIIVVDTGSTDETKMLAEVFGAKVFDYAWADDFAAARNYSLAQAKGDWILVMDADEIISTKDHGRLRELIKTSQSRKVAFSMMTRNYMNRNSTDDWVANDGVYGEEEKSTGWVPSQKVRLFPNDSQIRFEYPVHEIVDHALKRAGNRIRPTSIPIHHYGKLNHQLAQSKGETYYRIGLKKLEKTEDLPKALRELAIQAAELDHFEEAITLWRRVLEEEPSNSKAWANLAALYVKTKQYDESNKAARKAVDFDPDRKEGHLNLGVSELYLGNANLAAEILSSLRKRNPDYLPAIFFCGAAQICAAEVSLGLNTFTELKHYPTWQYNAYAFSDLAKGLHRAGHPRYAHRLLAVAEDLNPGDEALLDLKTSLEAGQINFDRDHHPYQEALCN